MYKILLLITLVIFTGCSLDTQKKSLIKNNIIHNNNNKITKPNVAFVLSWKIERNIITYIPLKIKEKLKTVCINYNKFVLIEIYTTLDNVAKGTFECRAKRINY